MSRRLWVGLVIVGAVALLAGGALFVYVRYWPGLRPAFGPIPEIPAPKPTPGAVNETGLPLSLPRGFKIETFASGLGPARFMAVDSDGVLIVSITQDGKVVALPDTNGDGRADRTVTLAEGLNLPHGLAFHKALLYVAENDKVTRYEYKAMSLSNRQVIVPDLPPDGEHVTRTITFDEAGKMYVSVGSSGNLLVEEDARRAAILQFNDNGSGGRIFARGTRNAVGLTWHPITKELWATENGRDNLGDDLPPDEIDIIKDGGDYGWPYAYGNRVPDPAFGDVARARETLPAKIEIQAHSAPLGLVFYHANAFGSAYKDDLFVCFHGSWNRSVPTGYKVVRFHMTGANKDQVERQEGFISGWLTSDGALGRPVAVVVGSDEALYISDDKAGVVYRVSRLGVKAGGR